MAENIVIPTHLKEKLLAKGVTAFVRGESVVLIKSISSDKRVGVERVFVDLEDSTLDEVKVLEGSEILCQKVEDYKNRR